VKQYQFRGRGKLLAGVAALVLLSACSSLPTKQLDPSEEPVITGPTSRRNFTPMEPVFACTAQAMRDKHVPVAAIAVGDVKDYTGKYSQSEGSTITQGGALMIYSALGKLGDVIQLQERFDTRIAELELAYTDKRQLGDGRAHQVESGKPAVPWVPYFGGSILRSNFYIVGGITELNYNIASGGVELTVNGVGAKRRSYTMNIGVDLRIVDTRTLVVVKTISLQKQIVGQEVGAGVYRFFGNTLVDVNIGNKSQEPLQLGVRTAIEHGVIELMSAVAGLDSAPCLAQATDRLNIVGGSLSPVLPQPATFPQPQPAAPAAAPAPGPSEPAAAPAPTAPAPVAVATPVPNAGTPSNSPAAQQPPEAASSTGMAPQNSMTAPASVFNVPFEFGSGALSADGMAVLDRVAADAIKGQHVSFNLVARDTENWSPIQRRELTNQRIKSVTDALSAKGISGARIGVSWMPSPTDTSITRDGPGFQLVATLVIAR
jgi:curli biogenesis system outer membrane secretion channel CsgG/outer membrane protein OmpA-like peptidoglycan-associated protein